MYVRAVCYCWESKERQQHQAAQFLVEHLRRKFQTNVEHFFADWKILHPSRHAVPQEQQQHSALLNCCSLLLLLQFSAPQTAT
jgi:hypothetical protein